MAERETGQHPRLPARFTPPKGVSRRGIGAWGASNNIAGKQSADPHRFLAAPVNPTVEAGPGHWPVVLVAWVRKGTSSILLRDREER